MRSNSLSMAFKALGCLLISCLGALSIADSGVLGSPTINVFLSICLFILVKSCLVYLALPVGGMHIYNCHTHLLDTSFKSNIVSFCISKYSH